MNYFTLLSMIEMNQLKCRASANQIPIALLQPKPFSCQPRHQTQLRLSAMIRRLLIILSLTVFCGPVAADDRLDDAISRATKILQTGVKNHPDHRSCFSCHHQALPLLAFSIGNLDSSDAREQFYRQSITGDVLDFTSRAFTPKIDTLSSGGEIGGRALTVAYGLWTFDLAGAEANATTKAMVENLLKTQDEHGAWSFQSLRPPAASSRLMTTAVAIYGLRSYGAAVEPERIQYAFRRAYQYSLSQTPAHHEDLIGQLWLESMIVEEQGRGAMLTSALKSDATPNSDKATLEGNSGNGSLIASLIQIDFAKARTRLEQLCQQLLNEQKSDGGWAQTKDMPPDAYATGQALIMLSHIRGLGITTIDGSAFDSGISFLIAQQKSDGSWFVASRSKPVQLFFDNGDPHGKDQFISMMATAWGAAALREAKFQSGRPLTSPRVEQRLKGLNRIESE